MSGLLSAYTTTALGGRQKYGRNTSRDGSRRPREQRKKENAAAEGEKQETETEKGGPEDPQEGADNCTRFVDLVQTTFREDKLTEEATWQAVVLIPKKKKDYRGIGLVEVMWKVVVVILNRRLTASITYHDFLHGFRVGRGTGTISLKANQLQQLAALREEILYVIFLDLHKAYDALDRSRCLEMLEGYAVGPKDRKLLQTY